jgi:hypothetical protein
MNRLEKQLTVILIFGGLPAMAADPIFAMAGVALGQTLRLNVEAFPNGPCRAQLSFVDRNGSQSPSTPIKTVDLNPGQADFLDLNANTVVNQFGQRVEVRPVVTLLSSPTPSVCQATAEVFDNASGFSLLALQPASVGTPPPFFGMAGIALGQVLRINVLAFPSGPCRAQLSFVDRNGTQYPSGPVKTVHLNPGQADSLDISAASLGVQFGHRVELRPVVTIASSVDQPSACAANVEVFDSFTGRTWESATPTPNPV